ncbi:DUF3043 domain-containing protein [Actinomyces sp. W5033]|uniref:DUF3043 domain-containing protein n=1 Tax=Actinomyces sp. W5033 TaxID=3446479 RepID=UPI003EE042D7
MFKKDKGQVPAPSSPAVVSTRGAGKGRPTPKRKDAQARGLHPVVPTDRKAAKREQRARQDAAWERQRIAMVTGDDRYLPARDKGPVRRYIRDYIDARWCLGELFLPASLLMLLVIVGLSLRSTTTMAVVSFWVLTAVYGLLALALVDAVWCWYRLRGQLQEKFGREQVRATGMIAWYVFGRCFTTRRWRQPKPQVARGHYPS